MQRPKTAKYLLRFDDICPTMNWKVWAEIEATLIEYRLAPILAVVPDNQDPVLQVDSPMVNFWDRVREWQARGWAIALHGFQHKYVARHAGIITSCKLTEFAGVPATQQEEKLRRGTEIFKREGIQPKVWIAPNDSFDTITVSLLPRFGIHIICDGFFRFPFVGQQMLTWVPQQLYGFRPAPSGVWTVAYHHNHWTTADLSRFREDLRRFRADLSSLDEVLQVWNGHRSWWSEWLCTNPRMSQFLIRVELKLRELRLSSLNSLGPVMPWLRSAGQHNISN